MAWLEVQWKCLVKDCGYVQRTMLGPLAENQSARCVMCKAQHHIDILPRVKVALWENENEPE